VHETLAPLTERYFLLGWSLGGQFALDLAAAMPAGVERLVLVATTPKSSPPGLALWDGPALLTKLAAPCAPGRDAAGGGLSGVVRPRGAPRRH